MQYQKPPLSFEDQASLLMQRGLMADRAVLVSRLNAVNYYRLSAYLYPYRLYGSDDFIEGTTLDLVWKHYTFDRQLRLLTMDAIERVEVAIRTQLICQFANQYGAFGYMDIATLPGLDLVKYNNWIMSLKMEMERSKARFIKHFKSKYGDSHTMLPVWMLAELMSFGRMFTFFMGVNADLQRCIASEYGVVDIVLMSWLKTLNTIRNICAHHGRLWNQELGLKPLIPNQRKNPEWHYPVEISNSHMFAVLTILRYLLGIIAPTSAWSSRLRNLFADYPEVSIINMGFPSNWETSTLWRL